MIKKALLLTCMLMIEMQRCQPCTQFSESCTQSTSVTSIDEPEQIKIKVEGFFPKSKVTLKDPNYYDKTQTYLGFHLDQLLRTNPRFEDLVTRIRKNPHILKDYVVLFVSNDSYMPAMDLLYVLDCATSEVPRGWMNEVPCQDRLSSGFVATSQVNDGSKINGCNFEPVANRQPEVICPGDYYLVWPRLLGPKYEFKSPYQLKSITVMSKKDFYGAKIYPDPAAHPSLTSKGKQESVSNGFHHYLRYCSSCHSVNLSPIERARSFDFLVPVGLPEHMTVKSLIAFVHSDKPPPGAERFDPAEVTDTKVAEIYSYLEYLNDRKVCSSLKACQQLCDKSAGTNRTQYCTASRFLMHDK